MGGARGRRYSWVMNGSQASEPFNSRKESTMYIVAIHTISNPEKFWDAAKTLNVPPGLKLHTVFPSTDGAKGVCLWEGESFPPSSNSSRRRRAASPRTITWRSRRRTPSACRAEGDAMTMHRRSRRRQDPPAGRLVHRRLRRRRHHAADRRRERCARPSTCAPASACSTSPPATATPRSRRRAAGAT